MKKQALIVCLFLCATCATQAQITTFDSTALYNIETKDGNMYQGKIIAADSEQVVFQSSTIGQISIPQANIKSSKFIRDKDIQDGEYWYESPYSTRYFYGPNAYGLKKGEGYYQNTWVFFNQVSYGFADNFTVGVGTVPIFLFGGDVIPVWITPKLTIPAIENKLNFMAGGLVAGVLGEDTDGPFGILYTGATVGDRNINGTLGLGWGYAGGQIADRPTISLSAMGRVSKRFFLMTENYFINAGTESIGILSVGGRVAYPKIAIDFGLFRPTEAGGLIALPWLGVHVPFGNTK